jgi:hypothetical protein
MDTVPGSHRWPTGHHAHRVVVTTDSLAVVAGELVAVLAVVSPALAWVLRVGPHPAGIA